MSSPTLALVKSHKGKLFTHCEYAYSYKGDSKFFSVSEDQKSIFDLASLTKVLCTTTLLAIAVDEKKIKLSDPLKTYLPHFHSSKPTIATTLQHSAGFEAWLPLYKLKTKQEYLNTISQSYDEKKFLTQVLYSDLGFILLGFLLEEIYGKNLNLILESYGYTNLKFNPENKNEIIDTGLSPHEKSPTLGLVNDDNTRTLGSACGHSGLFGNTKSVLKIGKEWLLALKGKSSLLTEKTARTFWNEKPYPKTSRSLGWDGVEQDGSSSAGSHFSSSTRGHLGFTGTSLWCDPEKDLLVTLLTNRTLLAKDVFDKKPMYEFRKTFHNSLVEEILKESP